MRECFHDDLLFINNLIPDAPLVLSSNCSFKESVKWNQIHSARAFDKHPQLRLLYRGPSPEMRFRERNHAMIPVRLRMSKGGPGAVAVCREQEVGSLLTWASEEMGIKAPKLKGGYVDGLRGMFLTLVVGCL